MPSTRLVALLLAAAAGLGAYVLPGTQLADSDPAPARPAPVDVSGPFKPVARVGSLMTGMASAMGEIRDALPSDDPHRMSMVAKWSEVVAELSNVHLRHRREDDYLAMAGDTRTLALDLARAARADEPAEETLWELVTALDTSCSTCHDAQG